MEDSSSGGNNYNRLSMTGTMTRQEIDNEQQQNKDGNLVVDLGELSSSNSSSSDSNVVVGGVQNQVAEPESPVLFQVILLVINPTASDENSIFELLRVQVFNIETTVKDLLDQIPRLATKKAIRRQTYRRGVIGNPMTMKVSGYLLFPKSVRVHKLLLGRGPSMSSSSSPASSQHQSPRSSISSTSFQQQQLEKTVVLVPLPEEVTVSECAEEACTILQDPSVCKLVRATHPDTALAYPGRSPLTDSFFPCVSFIADNCRC